MASSSSMSLGTRSSSSSYKHSGATLFIPSLKELAAMQFIKQFDNIHDIEEFILDNPEIDIRAMLEETLAWLQIQINALLCHVVKGEQKEAEDVIKSNPQLCSQLLLSRGRVVDYSDRTIEGTALQMALGAEDIRYHENEECMVEMIQRYLIQLPNGEEAITAQITEQFPKDYEDLEKERAKNDLVVLTNVVDAISQSQNDDDCEAALQAFRDYLKPKAVIKIGKHFNTQLLVEALNLYDKNYDAFGGWDSRKNNLFWRKVIGYTQRFLPANYAQAFCQGIYSIVKGFAEDGEPLTRSFKFRHDEDIFLFPLDTDPFFRLGYDYAASRIGSGLRTHSGPENGASATYFTSYVKLKASTVRELTRQSESYVKIWKAEKVCLFKRNI